MFGEKVERLVRFVKENFLAGRAYENAARPDASAPGWCSARGSRYRKALDCVPLEEHARSCSARAALPGAADELSMYLCPRRRISFDGFVSYEGRRFGVPHWYPGRPCRAGREGRYPRTYSDGLPRELAVHEVTWSRRDSFCEGQYADGQPEELPSVPVTVRIAQTGPPARDDGFAKFDFGRGLQ